MGRSYIYTRKRKQKEKRKEKMRTERKLTRGEIEMKTIDFGLIELLLAHFHILLHHRVKLEIHSIS